MSGVSTLQQWKESLDLTRKQRDLPESLRKYIECVQAQIKWKRARKPSTAELAEHMEEMYENATLTGKSTSEIETEIIEEMGDPITLGKALNDVHKPKFNRALFGIFSLLIIIGVILNLTCREEVNVSKFLILNLIGLTFFIISYFVDYTLFIKRINWIAIGFYILMLLQFLYDARNGISNIGYGMGIYFVMLYSIVSIAVYTLSRCPMKYSILMLSFLFPIYICTVEEHIEGLVICGFSLLLMYGIDWKEHNEGKVRLVDSIGLILILAYIIRALYIKNVKLENYLLLVKEIFKNIKLVGTIKNESVHLDILDWSDHAFLFWGAKFGLIAFLLVLMVYILLIVQLMKMEKRHIYVVNKRIMLQGISILLVQITGAFINCLGVLYVGGFSLPFVAEGGVLTLINYTIMGILMSMYRNEDMVVDLIRLRGGI